jgi:nitrate/TMAO reductase-like tetraheme cytochrome c subunit
VTLTIILATCALGLLVPLVTRPSLTMKPAGKIFAFVAIMVVPVVAGFAGLNQHIEHSKTVAFCTSCHVMSQYERSLHVDDVDHVPAKHWQYGRVPRETACFACHTDYTMYGDYKAKLRGLRHVYAQYIGTVPPKLHLYTPYNNRECLHCHAGARSFVDAVTHRSEPGRMEAVLANRTSCLTKGCHDITHTVDKIDGLAMWPAAAKEKRQ